MNIRRYLFVISVCACLSGQGAAAELRPADAEYAVRWGALTLAKASVAVTRGRRGLWHARAEVSPGAVAAAFAREVTVEERFREREGKIAATSVEFKRKDWVYESYKVVGKHARVVYDEEVYAIAATSPVTSIMTMMLQAGRYAETASPGALHSLAVLTRGKLREHEFVGGKPEIIRTALGDLLTRVATIERGGKLRYKLWFSEKHGRLPVRLQRFKGGDVSWTAEAVKMQ